MKALLIFVSVLFLGTGCESSSDRPGSNTTQADSNPSQTDPANPTATPAQANSNPSQTAANPTATPAGWRITEEAQECIDKKDKEVDARSFPECEVFEAQHGVDGRLFKEKIDFFVGHEDRDLSFAWGKACREEHDLRSKFSHECTIEFGETIGQRTMKLDDKPKNHTTGPPKQKTPQ